MLQKHVLYSQQAPQTRQRRLGRVVQRVVLATPWEGFGFDSRGRDLGPNRGERTLARSRKSIAARFTRNVSQEAFLRRPQEA